MFEEARRQKPVASMALNWCFNEPWPCAANNSVVSWPCRPKPALDAIARACRPTLASARLRKFAWFTGEIFDPEIWVLHDGPDDIPSVSITATLDCDDTTMEIVSWKSTQIAANTNRRGPRAQIILPNISNSLFRLHLRVEEHPEWDSTYTLKVLPRPVSDQLEEADRPLNI
jgi:beta-mannosidase